MPKSLRYDLRKLKESQEPPPPKRPRGRPKGSKTKRTLERHAFHEELRKGNNLEPLEVMLTNMRFYHEQAESLVAQMSRATGDNAVAPDVATKVLEMKQLSQACAVEAAR